MDAWRAMITAQGGDPDAALPKAAETHAVLANSDGVLVRLDALAVGVSAWRLGAGRARKEDPVQAAGVQLHANRVQRSALANPCSPSTHDPERFEPALQALVGGFDIAPPGARLLDDPC
jgi:thymidine phosphorylase